MQHAPGAKHPAPTVYALPEHAHVELIQLRDHLDLMAKLTEVGTAASAFDARLRPDALAWWFSRLSRDIGGILRSTYWSAAVANAPAPVTARKRKTRKSEQRQHA